MNDGGSRPQSVVIEIEGIPAEGLANTRSDITIIGGGCSNRWQQQPVYRRKGSSSLSHLVHTVISHFALMGDGSLALVW